VLNYQIMLKTIESLQGCLLRRRAWGERRMLEPE
jgi:hypothetical protein